MELSFPCLNTKAGFNPSCLLKIYIPLLLETYQFILSIWAKSLKLVSVATVFVSRKLWVNFFVLVLNMTKPSILPINNSL